MCTMVHVFEREPQQINLIKHMLYNSFLSLFSNTFHQKSIKVLIKWLKYNKNH